MPPCVPNWPNSLTHPFLSWVSGWLSEWLLHCKRGFIDLKYKKYPNMTPKKCQQVSPVQFSVIYEGRSLSLHWQYHGDILVTKTWYSTLCSRLTTFLDPYFPVPVTMSILLLQVLATITGFCLPKLVCQLHSIETREHISDSERNLIALVGWEPADICTASQHI